MMRNGDISDSSKLTHGSELWRAGTGVCDATLLSTNNSPDGEQGGKLYLGPRPPDCLSVGFPTSSLRCSKMGMVTQHVFLHWPFI